MMSSKKFIVALFLIGAIGAAGIQVDAPLKRGPGKKSMFAPDESSSEESQDMSKKGKKAKANVSAKAKKPQDSEFKNNHKALAKSVTVGNTVASKFKKAQSLTGPSKRLPAVKKTSTCKQSMQLPSLQSQDTKIFDADPFHLPLPAFSPQQPTLQRQHAIQPLQRNSFQPQGVPQLQSLFGNQGLPGFHFGRQDNEGEEDVTAIEGVLKDDPVDEAILSDAAATKANVVSLEIGELGNADNVLALDTSETGTVLHGLLSIDPTSLPATEEAAAEKKDVVLVLDVSGSMTGANIESVKVAAKAVIDMLSDRERLSLITFNNDASVLMGLKRMTTKNKKMAEKIVNNMRAGGGTDFKCALAQTFTLLDSREHATSRSADILFLSDGQDSFGNVEAIYVPVQTAQQLRSGEILNSADRTAVAPQDIDTQNFQGKYVKKVSFGTGLFRSVHTIGIGSGVDSKRLQKISQSNGGQYFYIEKTNANSEGPTTELAFKAWVETYVTDMAITRARLRLAANNGKISKVDLPGWKKGSADATAVQDLGKEFQLTVPFTVIVPGAVDVAARLDFVSANRRFYAEVAIKKAKKDIKPVSLSNMKAILTYQYNSIQRTIGDGFQGYGVTQANHIRDFLTRIRPIVARFNAKAQELFSDDEDITQYRAGLDMAVQQLERDERNLRDGRQAQNLNRLQSFGSTQRSSNLSMSINSSLKDSSFSLFRKSSMNSFSGTF